MYKDFENIQQKQRLFPFILRNVSQSGVIGRGPTTTMRKLLIFFKRRLNKNSKLCRKFVPNCRNKFIFKLVLQKNTCSRCVLFVHKLGKLDHVIHGAAKVNTSGKTNLPTYQETLYSALSPKAGKPKLRHIRVDLLVN